MTVNKMDNNKTIKGKKLRKIICACLLCGICSICMPNISTAVETVETDGEIPAFVEGSVIVTFAEDVSEEEAEDIIDEFGGEEVNFIDESGEVALVELEERQDTLDAVNEMSDSAAIESAQPNYLYTLNDDLDDTNNGGVTDEGSGEADGSDTGASDANNESGDTNEDDAASAKASEYSTWNLDYMRVQEAWNLIDQIRPLSERSEEDKVIVASLDTGIVSHEDIGENIDFDSCVTVSDAEQEGHDSDQDSDEETEEAVKEGYSKYSDVEKAHGTYIAGIVAATSYNGLGVAGVAAGNNNDLISFLPIRVFSSEYTYQNQSSATTVDVIKGIEYACSKNADVIVMCLGHGENSVDGNGAYHDDAALKAAVDSAVTDFDAVVVCSAGNNNDTKAWYPSDFDSAISVINTGAYSNAWVKSTKYSSSSYGSKKDVSAPGNNTYTTAKSGGYRKAGGTSAAAANAAGVVALIRYANPELSANEVRMILYSTATDLYTNGYDIYTGYGNVNAYKAVAFATNTTLSEEDNENLKAVSGLKATSAGTSSVKLSWSKVSQSSISGYEVYRAASENGTYKLVKRITDKSVVTYTDKNLKFNTKYYYKVRAIGTSAKTYGKLYGKFSKVVKGRAITATPKLKATNVKKKTVKLSWSKISKAKGYQIYRATSKSGKYKKVKTINKYKTTSWKNTKLKKGKTYYYKVRTYRVVSGKTVYGDWSDVKAVKIKK